MFWYPSSQYLIVASVEKLIEHVEFARKSERRHICIYDAIYMRMCEPPPDLLFEVHAGYGVPSGGRHRDQS